MSKRASYLEAIEWIVENDDTSWVNATDVEEYLTSVVSVALVADIFGKERLKVAIDIYNLQHKLTRADRLKMSDFYE